MHSAPTRMLLQGAILPDVPEGTEASIFAVYNDKKQLQYVGLSKDLRNSLRTVFSRRPDKTHFCKSVPSVLLADCLALGSICTSCTRNATALLIGCKPLARHHISCVLCVRKEICVSQGVG